MKKRPKGAFVKNDPRINRKGSPPGGNPGAGRPSEIHRAACRKLFEENKFNEFLAGAGNGEKVDITVTQDGKVLKIPTSFRNRFLAIAWLGEQGYGKAPQEIQHRISVEVQEQFERRLFALLQKYFVKMCPHCRTAFEMPVGLAKEIEELAKILEVNDAPGTPVPA